MFLCETIFGPSDAEQSDNACPAGAEYDKSASADASSISETARYALEVRMSFQPPVPVEKVLKEIYRKAYVLPAIQREFVWATEKVRMLFDSLLRGYPIGSFLFWTVESDRPRTSPSTTSFATITRRTAPTPRRSRFPPVRG